MRKFSLNRMGRRARWSRASTLAWGPLCAALACNVYDDSLTGGLASPLAGSGNAGDAGSHAAGSGGTGATSGSNAAGDDSGGSGATTSMAGSGGSTNGGATGGGGNGGSAGTATAGSGGSGGSGTTMAGSGGKANADGDLVDDMEDNDAGILPSGGRNGYWYTGADTTANAVLTPPANKFAMTALSVGDRSDFAASVKAENFADWGSDIGFNFVEKNALPQAYDASAYCGVRFWGKAAAPVSLRFRVPDVNTHPAGGVCKISGAANTLCYDHFSSAVQFGKTWMQYTFKFADLTQVGSGYHPADNKLAVKSLYAVEWALPGGTPKTYQIWIDDVELVKCP